MHIPYLGRLGSCEDNDCDFDLVKKSLPLFSFGLWASVSEVTAVGGALHRHASWIRGG